MKLKIWAVAGLAAMPVVVSAQSLRSSTPLTNSITGSVSDGSAAIPYRLYEPAGASAGQKMPLILYLHGMGERGSDNSLQTYNMGQLLAHTQTGKYSSYILAPQINSSQWFAGGSTQTEAMKLTLKAVHEVIDSGVVDPSRVYVTGVSMGGMGTWDAIRREPGTFAAAVPMSGGYDPKAAAAMKDVPVWAFHGSADTLVPVQSTRDMVSALAAAGGDVKYTEIAGGGHTIWDGVYSDPTASLYSWLFSQTADGSPAGTGTVLASPGAPVLADLPVVTIDEPVVALPPVLAAPTVVDGTTIVNIAASPVPEPSVMGVGLIAGLVGLVRRSRRS